METTNNNMETTAEEIKRMNNTLLNQYIDSITYELELVMDKQNWLTSLFNKKDYKSKIKNMINKFKECKNIELTWYHTYDQGLLLSIPDWTGFTRLKKIKSVINSEASILYDLSFLWKKDEEGLAEISSVFNILKEKYDNIWKIVKNDAMDRALDVMTKNS